MVLKMLYNWDDMHIFALLSLKKTLMLAAVAAAAAQVFG